MAPWDRLHRPEWDERLMRRWIAAHSKSLAALAVGAAGLAAYVVADPGELPKSVVTAAVIINALAVYLAPKNAQPVTARDVRRSVEYYGQAGGERHARRDEAPGPPTRHVRGDRPARGEEPPGTSFP